ncbi:hypothetical protein COU77_03080 [Candidatus Peregrinibacteria bacterium CG10_big_fil_rev_8_21_14_0_10_49_16]|nr:MAG: hypothetical protein COW95_02595 [Candidatus Peregrinibacteria bacterium CG22_combo_CG10-13_8_21_14_all_49_11]PIR52017.1 MAG: hypothetical protein COU77_03080 [Candidatus Peregrinibacteria bacterium CG10_big_fil_rev_8_21_14_0_10_49_16]
MKEKCHSIPITLPNLNRWWDETKEYAQAGPNAPSDVIGHTIHRTSRLAAGAIHAVTEGFDAAIDDLTRIGDNGINIRRMPEGPFPRMRRTTVEGIDALFHLKPFTALGKGVSLLGKWIPDTADFVIGNYRSHVHRTLSQKPEYATAA